MGFMATVVVLMDGLNHIEKDPDFGNKLAKAITHKYHHPNDNNVWVFPEHGGNVCHVAEVHHADQTVYVRVGQNCGIPMDTKSVTKKYVTLTIRPENKSTLERWG